MVKVARGHIACPDGHQQSIYTALVAYAYDKDDYGSHRLVLRPESYPPGYAQRMATKRAAAERAMREERVDQRGAKPESQRFARNQLAGGVLERMDRGDYS
jgi:hypothetical protein